MEITNNMSDNSKTINKKCDVDIVYDWKNNKIIVTGDGIGATLNITSAELKNMYWKGKGKGSIDVTIHE